MKNFLGFVVLIFTLLLSACGQKLDGVYKDELGLQKYEFKRDGTVYVTTMGSTKEASYTTEDQKVKILSEGEQSVYEINGDGSIKGPLGMILRPVSPK